MFQVMTRDNTYKDLFSSVVSIYKIVHNKGLLRGYFSEDNFKTVFSSSKRILEAAVDTYCAGYMDSIFFFNIELEYNRAINQDISISDKELCEITLAKEMVRYIRERNYEAINDVIGYFCDGTTRSELFLDREWANRPV